MNGGSSFVAAALSCVLLAACDENPVGPREEQWTRPAILPTRPVESITMDATMAHSTAGLIIYRHKNN